MDRRDDIIPVIAGVIERNGKILIAKRKMNGLMGGKWEFPGGKLETMETPQECLKRELFEEFGIETETGDFIHSTIHPLSCQVTIELAAYKVRYISGEFQLRDHDEIKWVRPRELDGYDFPDADYAVVKKLMEEE